MNILIISECSKQALSETLRVLDQFAERKGQRTWQTPITFEGLKTLRILLKKSARRNTAVACYSTYGKNNTTLLWIVGNRKRFNLDGTVPTNRTQRNILRKGDENEMHSNQASAVMAGIAGLFHDLGKANTLFQNKLLKKGKNNLKNYEPYRHEWVSAQLFLSFVKDQNDDAWLESLKTLDARADQTLLAQFSHQSVLSFAKMSPLVASIAWLIVTHHRLPQDLKGNDHDIFRVESWFAGIDAGWNALNHTHDVFSEQDKQAVFTFPMGTPLASITWRKKAKELASRAIKLHNLHDYAKPDRPYPLHIARMALMLADHAYSADSAKIHWQDPQYNAIANTDKKTKKPNQKLDEHCVGVGHNAYLLACAVPNLRAALPSLTHHPFLKKRTVEPRFRWQNNAYDRACALRELSQEHGFFGVNMASTGKGKTFANARIMYGLSDPQTGCRFSVALGLRTLTLQTGDALKERLKLEDDDLAVVIGSSAVSALHNKHAQNKKSLDEEEKADSFGSASQQMFADHLYVKYDGEIEDHYLKRWLNSDSNARKFVKPLISAPISVSTIDYLVPVSEGVRGGKQIAPMLRLLTSDLVLDEPDDFGIEDLPALSRLVYWAGLLGSRVLLSSATLPPSLICSLFDAYRAGRQQFNLVNGPQREMPVITYWCDEFGASSGECSQVKDYRAQHKIFTQKREEQLQKQSLALHVGTFLSIEKNEHENPVDTFAKTVLNAAQALAAIHNTTTIKDDTQGQKPRQKPPRHEGKTFSAGIIRMANIEPLVGVGMKMLLIPPNENTRIHYCFYHSQHPLAVRSEIEHNLDLLLKRDPNIPVTALPQVQAAFSHYPEQHHIFIVLATPVAEVGRDHDYDWAIIEPSSMRSIIQLAGRVQRHRQCPPSAPNIRVLTQNFRALKGKKVAFCKPGFEDNNAYLLNNKKGEWRMVVPQKPPSH